MRRGRRQWPQRRRTVEAVHVDAGYTVQVGDLLAQLDDEVQVNTQRAAAANVERLEALLENQQRTVTRNQDLVGRKLAAESTLDDATSQLAALKAQLDEGAPGGTTPNATFGRPGYSAPSAASSRRGGFRLGTSSASASRCSTSWSRTGCKPSRRFPRPSATACAWGRRPMSRQCAPRTP